MMMKDDIELGYCIAAGLYICMWPGVGFKSIGGE